MLNVFVDLEFLVSFEIFPDSCFGIVARPPRAVREHFPGHVLNDGIENDTVAADAGEWRICLQFGQHVIVRVVAVEADQYARVVSGESLDLINNLWRNAGTLNHLYARRHRVRLNGGAVMRANINVDAQHHTARNFRIQILARLDGIAYIQ